MNKRVAIFTTHLIQYQIPLFKKLAKIIDLHVFFGSKQGLSSYHDKDFNKQIKWNIPLIKGYKYSILKNSNKISLDSFFFNSSGIKEAIKKNFDKVIILGWNNIFYLKTFFWCLYYSSEIIIRSENNLYKKQPLFKKILKEIILRIFFKFINSFISIGSLNEEFYKYYGVKKNKIFRAPYSIDDNFFKKNIVRNKQKWKKNNNISNQAKIFLFVGKLIKRKRVLDLIKVAQSKKLNNNSYFLIIGDGPLKKKLLQKINNLKLNNISILGFKSQNQLRFYYSLADVLILPSEYETWGLVINEAMSAGVPCIVSDSCGAAKDMIIKYKTGFQYKNGNINQLIKLINLIINNKDILFDLKKNTFLYSRKFSLNKTVEGFLNAINS
ncbi:RfaG Glycosyltransferase [Candidatus Pelagibacterales bacterium]